MTTEARSEFDAWMNLHEDVREGRRFTIELDCAPGCMRPWDVMAMSVMPVLKRHGIEFPIEKGAFFGAATYVIPEGEMTERYREVRDEIRRVITALHDSGVIRYGSW